MISEKDIEHIAELAKLHLSKRELANLRGEMNDILSYFRTIDEADTEGVTPAFHVQDLVNVLRDDTPQSNEPDPLLNNAPQKKGRFIKAPRIV
jgi:aspartyl-tRNA(Asn)/glutamyl-tRNA(Gln) amidotransferase subunit C